MMGVLSSVVGTQYAGLRQVMGVLLAKGQGAKLAKGKFWAACSCRAGRAGSWERDIRRYGREK